MAIEFGVPVWTTGGFTRRSGRDDLGLEGVGIGMLQRLLPGIVQTTPNAGYYSLYCYLLARWEDLGGSIRTADFAGFYRRHEVAFVAGCLLHAHRAPLRGVSGNQAVSRALAEADRTSIDIAALANLGSGGYLKDRLGGFGMFYRAALRNLRLTIEGEGNVVDRVTERGRSLGEAFAAAWEGSEYFRSFGDVDSVPVPVLAELGERTCLCTIPGRDDHDLLLNSFFGSTEDQPRWEPRRQTRIGSLGLFLEFHDQRPEEVPGSLGSWRRAIGSHRFPNGAAWSTAFHETRHSWRAYQARDAELMALSGLWVSFLTRLSQLEPARRGVVRDSLVAEAQWALVDLTHETLTVDSLDQLAHTVPEPEDWIGVAERLAHPQHVEVGVYLIDCLRVIAGVTDHLDVTADGFDQLADDGGAGQWSLAHLRRWLSDRAEDPIGETLASLIDAMVFQHQSVALTKVHPLGLRDPFCVAEDNGLLWVIRDDEPTWAEARFGTVNHLLWTLGLTSGPEGDSRLTPLGIETLTMIAQDA